MFRFFKSLFRKRETQHATFSHPELGVLSGESNLWSGSVSRNGNRIRFTIAGSATAPDDELLVRIRELVQNFAEIEEQGAAFLRREIPDVRSLKLQVYQVELLWQEAPDSFAFEWLADGDDSCVWRVNYLQGKPVEAGFDD